MTVVTGKSHPNLNIVRRAFLNLLQQRKSVNPWAGTDPKRHDPNHFRYLAHAVTFRNFPTGTEKRLEIDLLESPERISDDISLISTSLIDPDHPTTWTSGGFILEVEPNHVLDASSTDMGTNSFGPQRVVESFQAKRRQGYTPPTPDEILSKTDPRWHNEVVLAGNINGRPVKITGVFIKQTSHGRVKNLPLEQRLRELASIHGWPMVYIQDVPRRHFDDNAPVYLSPDCLALNWKGKRYFFEFKNREFPSFIVGEDGGEEWHPMTPMERLEAIRYIRNLIAANPESVQIELGVIVTTIEALNRLENQSVIVTAIEALDRLESLIERIEKVDDARLVERACQVYKTDN